MSESGRSFWTERSKIPIPSGEVARVKLLAKELAKGYDKGLWQYIGKWVGAGAPHESNVCIRRYFLERWQVWDFHDSVFRLQRHGYTQQGELYEELTQSAIALIDEPKDSQLYDKAEPYDGFISYKRSENSLLAMLVRNTLRLHAFTPFIDMEINPTEEWHARLENQVKASNYFVALLGPHTHESKYTVREIYWAFKHEIPIVQLWQHGFTVEPRKWEF